MGVDSIFIGGGDNGLVATNYLGCAGAEIARAIHSLCVLICGLKDG
jgi:hypothetical protein